MFDCAYRDDIWSVESVAGFDRGDFVGIRYALELVCASLVYNVDFSPVDAIVCDEVAFGALRYCEYSGGVFGSLSEFIIINLPVEGFVILR